MTGQRKFLIHIKQIVCGALLLPVLAGASVSTTISWTPSADNNVVGYDIYYGTQSHNYTNVVYVGNVTNTTIGNLAERVMYFFAAKSRDGAGHESEFSNEASFADYNVSPNGPLKLKTMPAELKNDELIFSLAPGAPAGASINTTNGLLSWTPGFADANSVNSITVIINDLTNPDANMQTTFFVNVSDFFNLALGSVAVQTGGTASLPIVIASSDPLTNVIFSVNWPGAQLLNPSLTFNAPISGGTLLNQGTNLIIQLWTAGDVLIGTNQIAQINFQAADQPSAFVNLTVSNVSSTKSDATTFANVTAQSGEVAVVGNNPLLRPHADENQNRTLTLYANPGANYQLQFSTDLSSSANWQPLQNYQPTNVQQTINLDSSTPVIFYRLMQQ